MQKPLIAFNGINGQLGWELNEYSKKAKDNFRYMGIDRSLFNLEDPKSIIHFFETYQPNYFINAAAYTAVDKAETESEKAYQINALSLETIALQCKKYQTTLISISTDYVFAGNGKVPYLPEMPTQPINVYGQTKREGELFALNLNPATIIVRTSWLYSSHGNNFVKTMLRLMKERDTLNVVNDQLGSPTYAADLAEALFLLIDQMQAGNAHYGIYQYSNQGVISWFDFAKAIQKYAGLTCQLSPIPTASYPTPAKRPFYSVMDLTKIQQDYGLPIPHWEASLIKCIERIKKDQ